MSAVSRIVGRVLDRRWPLAAMRRPIGGLALDGQGDGYRAGVPFASARKTEAPYRTPRDPQRPWSKA